MGAARPWSTFHGRLKLAFALLAATVFAALVLLRAGDLWWRRERIVTEGQQRAANLTLILAEYLAQVFKATDASLRQLSVHSVRVGGPGAPGDEWTPTLHSAMAALPNLGSISVADAQGVIRQSTNAIIIGQGRSEFYIFKRLSQEDTDALLADAPFRALIGSPPILIPLGRRLEKADGTFDGIIVATFAPETLRQFFESVDVGRGGLVSVFHPDGYVVIQEPSARNLIGETALGNPLFEVARRDGAGSLLGPVQAGGPPMISAFRTTTEPGLMVAVSLSEAEVLAEWAREVRVSAMVLGLIGVLLGGALYVVFRQVDARAEAEQALGRAQRLESLGRLTGGIAHDFNNMLTVIVGHTSMLKAEASVLSDRFLADAVDQIHEAAARAAALTRQLLAFARRQPLRPQVVDVNALIEALRPMLIRLLGEDVSLTIALTSAPCLASVDTVQLESALVNLCANARDAMPHGGRLLVETRSETLDERYARENPEVTPGPHVLISVVDTGVGIHQDDIARVLEPFYTTKEVGRGTGLGLSMVYGFVKQSGGHLRIESEPGQGTAVRMYFPSITGEVPVARKRPAAPARRATGEVILLVEDEEAVRKLASVLLSNLGYRVVAVADGPSALAAAAREARIDLLLTDVMLPNGMTGRQVAEELERQRPGLRVLFTSGYSEEFVIDRGHVAPGIKLLPKPYDRTTLAAAVREALRQPQGPSASTTP